VLGTPVGERLGLPGDRGSWSAGPVHYVDPDGQDALDEFAELLADEN
jgi:hypothetical protein